MTANCMYPHAVTLIMAIHREHQFLQLPSGGEPEPTLFTRRKTCIYQYLEVYLLHVSKRRPFLHWCFPYNEAIAPVALIWWCLWLCRFGFSTFLVHFMFNGSNEVRFGTFLNFTSCQETATLRLHYHIVSKQHLWYITTSINHCLYKLC